MTYFGGSPFGEAAKTGIIYIINIFLGEPMNVCAYNRGIYGHVVGAGVCSIFLGYM
jgi:hypothetical protein